jgi:hypothetical protein
MWRHWACAEVYSPNLCLEAGCLIPLFYCWCLYYLETAVSVTQPFLHGANTPQYCCDMQSWRLRLVEYVARMERKRTKNGYVILVRKRFGKRCFERLKWRRVNNIKTCLWVIYYEGGYIWPTIVSSGVFWYQRCWNLEFLYWRPTSVGAVISVCFICFNVQQAMPFYTQNVSVGTLESTKQQKLSLITIYIVTCISVFVRVTYKIGFGLNDGIYCTLYIHIS